MFRTDPKRSGPLLKQSAALFSNDETTLQMINYMLGRAWNLSDLYGAINVYEGMEARNRTYMGGFAWQSRITGRRISKAVSTDSNSAESEDHCQRHESMHGCSLKVMKSSSTS